MIGIDAPLTAWTDCTKSPKRVSLRKTLLIAVSSNMDHTSLNAIIQICLCLVSRTLARCFPSLCSIGSLASLYLAQIIASIRPPDPQGPAHFSFSRLCVPLARQRLTCHEHAPLSPTQSSNPRQSETSSTAVALSITVHRKHVCLWPIRLHVIGNL